MVFIFLPLLFLLAYWYITIPLAVLLYLSHIAKQKDKEYEAQLASRQEPALTLNTPTQRGTFVLHNGEWYQLTTYQQIQTAQRWERI